MYFLWRVTVSDINVIDIAISDHKAILFNLALDIDFAPERRMKSSRIINNAAVEKFRDCFDCNVLTSINGDVDCLVNSFNAHCSAILDDIAPVVTSSARPRSSPWMTEEIYALRQNRRRAERAWKASNLEVHRLYYKELTAEFNKMVELARADYFKNLICSSRNNARVLFNVIDSIIAPPFHLFRYPQMMTVTHSFNILLIRLQMSELASPLAPTPRFPVPLLFLHGVVFQLSLLKMF